MKLNCDVGESFGTWTMGSDEALMPYIDMANIACGFHASDPQTMDKTITLALKHGVTIGAHPGYPDLQGFGRKPMYFTSQELINITLYQVGALQALCHARGTKVSYVKPHGALYHRMMQDEPTYIALVKAVSLLEGNVGLMIMATSHSSSHSYNEIAIEHGVALIKEAFCDRGYTHEGFLQSRDEAGSVFVDIDHIKAQAQSLIHQRCVTSGSGQVIDVVCDTLCIHGDSPLALESVKALRAVLDTRE